MKLRCIPEDFQVTEVTDRHDNGGNFRLFELSKRSIGTLEAIERLRRHWNLGRGQISHGGLKDRHAVTTQRVTIRNGPEADYSDDLIEARCIGSTDRPFGAQDITANEFRIVVRSLQPEQIANSQASVDQTAANGFLNYFDTQRFGSLGASGKFIAAAWCLRDYEQALWLALAEHNPHDRPAERAEKQILRDAWGDWATCKQQLQRSNRRSVITYLVDHPENFRKAFALINSDLRGLYLSAFQSAVWNRMLAAMMPTNEDSNVIEIADARLPLPTELPVLDSRFAKLPLPSIRCRDADAGVRRLINQALEPYDMTRRQMKVHFPRDRWFSRALRSTIITPKNLSLESADDDLYAGSQKATLRFQLPRGCYATMLIKTLRLSEFTESPMELEDDDA